MILYIFFYIIYTSLLQYIVLCSGPNSFLRAHYKFSGNFSDLTGNFVDATPGGVTWTTDKDGTINGAVYFGGSQHIYLPIGIINGLVDYSISFQLKSDNNAHYSPSFYNLYKSGSSYTFFAQGYGVVSSAYNSWNSLMHDYDEFTNGHWQHIVISRNSANKKYYMYADGVQKVAYDSTSVENSYTIDAQAFVLGGNKETDSSWYTGNYFTGSMHDVKIYGKALNSSEVAQVKFNCITGCLVCSNEITCQTCKTTEGYFKNSTTNICDQCEEQCNTCSVSADNCDSCKGLNRNITDIPKCNCNIGYYPVVNQSDCPQCNNRCISCDQPGECIEWKDNRLAPLCILCDVKYFDQAGTCNLCHSRCKRCTGQAYNCDECENSSLSTINNCCQLNQYFDTDVYDCKNCQYPCIKCNNQTQCTECDGDMTHRNTDPDCNCLSRYYNEDVMGVNACKECPERYQECEDPSTPRVSCRGSNRKNMNVDDCVCQDNHYEDPSSENCLPCQYPCLECDSLNNCLSCIGTPTNRNSIPDCNCISRYYNEDVMGVNTCKVCPERYQECDDPYTPKVGCRGTNRKGMNIDDCVCQDNHYEDSFSENCLPCQYPCLECDSLNNCVTCDGSPINRNSDPDCNCYPRYYNEDVMGVNTCKECPKRYQECDDSTTPRVGCRGSNRKDMITNDCVCLDNHYEDPSSEHCLPCQYPCLQCNTLTNCLSCDGGPTNRNSDPDCNCISRYYNQDVMGVNTCKECPKRYQECNDPLTPRLGCRGINRKNLIVGNCLCQEKHYEDPFSVDCLPCLYPCLSCENIATNCILCDGTMENRNPSPVCDCEIGYYEEQSMKKCTKCPQKYQACFNPNNGICYDDINRDQNCQCNQGYFLDQNTQICESCSSYCLKCSDSLTCIQCANQNLTPPQCKKTSQSYVKNINNLLYNDIQIKCHSKCKICQSSANNCIQCVQGMNRYTIDKNCICKQGYHDENNTLKDCQKCPQGCIECKSSQQCLQCQNEMIFDESTRKCICRKGYKFDQFKKCKKCIIYKEQCIQSCPLNSEYNEERQQCIHKMEGVNINDSLIWTNCLIFLNMILLVFVCQSISLSQNRFMSNSKSKTQAV